MLKIHIQELGNAKIFCLQGRIGVVETEALSVAVRSHSDGKTVVLDLAQVIGIDAAGLGMLLELSEWTNAAGTEFRLMNVSARVRHILEITCLVSVFKTNSETKLLFQARSNKFGTIRPNNRFLGTTPDRKNVFLKIEA